MKRTMKKLFTSFAVFAALNFAVFSEEVDIQVKSYLTSDVSGDTGIVQNNVTWKETTDNLGNPIEAAYFSGDKSWLEIEDKPLSATSDISGFTISFKGNFEETSTWGRILDISNRTNLSSNFSGNNGNYFFLNLGNKTPSSESGYYTISNFEISYAYGGRDTEVRSAYFNHGDAVAGKGNLKTGITTDVEIGATQYPVSSIDDLFGKWHEYKLIVSKTGYSTLMVDDKPIVWVEGAETVKKVVKNLHTVTKGVYDYPDYYIGKSPWGDGDGYVKGYMKDLVFKCKAELYWDNSKQVWTDGDLFYHQVTYNSNGGTVYEKVYLDELPSPLPTPVNGTLEFLGWYTDKNFITPAVAGEKLTEDVTLYAKWAHGTHDGIDWNCWAEQFSLPEVTGNYALTKDILLTETWTPASGTVNIDLNGHKIYTNKAIRLFHINASTTLGIYDCGKTVEYKFTTTGNKWVLNDEAGTETVYGGILYGGNITGLTARGGCIYNEGTLNLYAGTITGNYSGGNGGAIYNANVLNIKNAAITGNGCGSSSNGGAIDTTTGTLTLGGSVKIYANKKGSTASNVYCTDPFSISTALESDSNIYVTNTTSLNAGEKVQIISNYSAASGVKFGSILHSDDTSLTITKKGDQKIYLHKLGKTSWQ